MIQELVDGRCLCIRLEVSEATTEFPAGQTTRPRTFVEAVRGSGGISPGASPSERSSKMAVSVEAAVSGGASVSDCSFEFPLLREEVGEVGHPSPITMAMEKAVDGVDINKLGYDGKS